MEQHHDDDQDRAAPPGQALLEQSDAHSRVQGRRVHRPALQGGAGAHARAGRGRTAARVVRSRPAAPQPSVAVDRLQGPARQLHGDRVHPQRRGELHRARCHAQGRRPRAPRQLRDAPPGDLDRAGHDLAHELRPDHRRRQAVGQPRQGRERLPLRAELLPAGLPRRAPPPQPAHAAGGVGRSVRGHARAGTPGASRVRRSVAPTGCDDV